MDTSKNVDFSIEKVELEISKMDSSNVEAGCWGDSGSDYANNC